MPLRANQDWDFSLPAAPRFVLRGLLRRQCLLLVFCCLVCCAPSARALYFGTNLAQPGRVITFEALPGVRARWEAGQVGKMPPRARGAFVMPQGATNLLRPIPILIVSVPSGGSAISALPGYTNVAWTEGWLVLAADGPRIAAEDDTVEWGIAMLGSVLEQFTRTWPQAKQWPVACAGFSGGAKRSAAAGAALLRDGWRVIGVFMGGCNEDRATLGMELFKPGAAFLPVPMFLSSGVGDRIATPAQVTAVRDSMARSGFTQIRLESYAGGHQLDPEQLVQALRWFRQAGGAR
ncbi:MAG TPA: hypothetical protein VNH84_19135 [Candidatus Saccharimonadales bacterium]|nr:hypothetical protein [Candidatus Saccharimonadales bacterium]